MRRVILAIVTTAVALVLLLSFKTHSGTSLATPPAAVASTTPTTSAGTPSATPSTAASATAAASTASSSEAPAAATTTKATSTKTTTATSKTVTGDAIDTRYGPVQVQITVTNGKLVAANATEYPQNEPRDDEINSYAVPVLNKEALAAGSAKIDIVSGATYTSDGYANSLQSALDKAGL